MTQPATSIRLVMAFTVIALAAGCAHAPTARQTVEMPVPAPTLDVLDVAADAARAVGLPAVTKLDRANGVIEFGAFQTGATDYTAQVQRRADGQLDVTVKRGSAEGPGTVEDKAREFVAALDARLRQAAPRAPQPPAPSPTPSSRPARPPAATPPAPAPSPAPSRPAPAPAPSAPAITLVVTAPQGNLRERGNPGAKLVRVLPRNTRVSVLGRANQWYLVRLDDGTEGWLAESVVAPAR